MRIKTVVICSCAFALATGCGAASKRAPTQQDASAVAAAVSDIVYQCRSVLAGFIASPDSTSVKRDVDALLRTYQTVQPDATFALGSPSGTTLTTTLRREITLAEANLGTPSCAPEEAKRLQDRVGH